MGRVGVPQWVPRLRRGRFTLSVRYAAQGATGVQGQSLRVWGAWAQEISRARRRSEQSRDGDGEGWRLQRSGGLDIGMARRAAEPGLGVRRARDGMKCVRRGMADGRSKQLESLAHPAVTGFPTRAWLNGSSVQCVLAPSATSGALPSRWRDTSLTIVLQGCPS